MGVSLHGTTRKQQGHHKGLGQGLWWELAVPLRLARGEKEVLC